MTRAARSPEAKQVLAAMTHGEVYSPSDLAKRFGTVAATLRPVLEQMADDGTVARVRSLRVRDCNYRIAGEAPAGSQPEKYVGVPAGRRTYNVMSGTLNGYDDENRRRADLCMMVRR
ncbi:hypothetical protein [Burkholderia vietnamiensis]|uniref:hypothetical protein n=1 Tax=Burkholderia vietnamiensis TaxID=60552 RepID=UPI001BA2C468|nr:hypothetical protein [Burkholderia vietnamiensis]MBR8151045.1 hypothetical protein [Burkholderia vietnamiensis]